MWMRGLKEDENEALNEQLERSHPMWMRGLKELSEQGMHSENLSHPMWMRGLKVSSESNEFMDLLVASYVDAWIESSLTCISLKSKCTSVNRVDT